ncbi:MAG: LemA family protein [Bacteroidota bacterium]
MSKGLVTTLVIVGALLLFGFIFVMWGSGVYDSSVRLQEDVNASWANVQTTYQRRADLIPNLVATVKGAAENEKEILTRVTEARSGISSAKTPEELDRVGKTINSTITMAFEAYPQIRSTENFQDLQAQLEGTENRINVSRQNYNESVKNYNTYIRGFFKKMALSWFGGGEDWSVKKGFEASEGSENAPAVKF